MWKKEKIDKQREYFRNQRVTKTGNFTEFVVRTFYCIYKACDDNKTNYCLKKEVEPLKIKYNIYEGIYGGIPDHDYYNVINDCFKHLYEMGYITYENINYKEIIIIKKKLDFLLKNEHEFYIKKYEIKENIDLENEDIKLEKIQNKGKSTKTNIKCTDCTNGYYVLREGMYGVFYGCNNFPKCRSTKSIADFMNIYLIEKGLNLYEETIYCWKCNKRISVLSYFLDLDLKINNIPTPAFDSLEAVRLGMIEEIDSYILNKYPNIQKRFSKKAGFSYTANICPHCNSLQGTQMALGKVYDNLLEDLKNGILERKIKENIIIDNKLLPKETIEEVTNILMNKDRGLIFSLL